MGVRKAEKFYWFNDNDYIAVGEFNSESDAREDAQQEAASHHTRAYTIVKVVSESPPPSMARKWKAA